jgi:hypothetical protein
MPDDYAQQRRLENAPMHHKTSLKCEARRVNRSDCVTRPRLIVHEFGVWPCGRVAATTLFALP